MPDSEMKMAERARGSCCAMASFPLSMSVSFLYACLGFQDLGVVEKCVSSLSAVCHFSNRSKQKREFTPYFFFYMPATNIANHSFFPSLPSYEATSSALLYRSETVAPAYLLACCSGGGCRRPLLSFPAIRVNRSENSEMQNEQKAITVLNKVEKQKNRPTNKTLVTEKKKQTCCDYSFDFPRY